MRNGERKVIQKKKERSGIEGTLSYQDWQQTTPENRWQVYPESEEAYRQELRREEEAQIERAREAGTTLLSASKNGEGTVRLEPVEAGGTVIQISYIPFTLGKTSRGCRTHVLTVLNRQAVFMRGSIRRRAYTF